MSEFAVSKVWRRLEPEVSTAAVVHDENKTSAAQGLYDSKHVPNQEDKPKSLMHEVA